MRRFSTVPFAAVSTITFTQIVSAADIPVKAPRPAIAPMSVYNWTGPYIGGNPWSTTDWTFF